MRQTTPWTEFPKYPIVAGTIALAAGVTIAGWAAKVDLTALTETVDIRRGELWRLLTSSLPHADPLHLIFNLYWTWTFGVLIEEAFGHLRTFVIFVLLAVVANGCEYAVLSGGIGLSGIGYGLFGLLWVLSRRDQRFSGAVDQRTIGLFIAWFFFCIALTLGGYPIGNVAHGMGAATGALLGWGISVRAGRRIMVGIAMGALVTLTLIGDTVARPWINLSTYGGYEEGELGYNELMSGHNEQALGWFKDAIRMKPRVASYWFDEGIAYQRLNRRAEAAAAYKRAHELDPSDPKYQTAAQDDSDS